MVQHLIRLRKLYTTLLLIILILAWPLHKEGEVPWGWVTELTNHVGTNHVHD